MIVIDSSQATCAQTFNAVDQDKGCYALFVVIQDSALAQRADSVADGKPWRRVVLDKGCPALVARWQEVLQGHAEAAGVMFDYGSAENDARKPAAFLPSTADVLQIEDAFEQATQHR